MGRSGCTDHGDGYAGRIGRPANGGVRGVAVLNELRRPVYDVRPRPAPCPMPRAAARQGESSANNRAADATAAYGKAESRQQLGTGHGEREWSQSSSTRFERASRAPAQVSELRYDTRSRLLALGVIPRLRPGNSRPPQAFPGGFVPDPPYGR